jgi:hypothetical protein
VRGREGCLSFSGRVQHQVCYSYSWLFRLWLFRQPLKLRDCGRDGEGHRAGLGRRMHGGGWTACRRQAGRRGGGQPSCSLSAAGQLASVHQCMTRHPDTKMRQRSHELVPCSRTFCRCLLLCRSLCHKCCAVQWLQLKQWQQWQQPAAALQQELLRRSRQCCLMHAAAYSCSPAAALPAWCSQRLWRSCASLAPKHLSVGAVLQHGSSAHPCHAMQLQNSRM